jgi:hypothetical protein
MHANGGHATRRLTVFAMCQRHALQMTAYTEQFLRNATVSPDRVLLRMIKSGHFYPAASWAYLNSRGLHVTRTAAVWRAVIDHKYVFKPNNRISLHVYSLSGQHNTHFRHVCSCACRSVTLEDIHTIFFASEYTRFEGVTRPRMPDFQDDTLFDNNDVSVCRTAAWLCKKQ